MNQIETLVKIAIVMFVVLSILSTLTQNYNLDKIKSQTIGDGQHGVARFASPKEVKENYKYIPYDVKSWRENKNRENAVQGIVVGYTKDKRNKVKAIVDIGDVHALMIGASGVGKTANFLYPNLEYACASGMSFITTDTKGDLARNYGLIAKVMYGYKISILDLRNPMKSDGNNLLHLVNKYVDEYKINNDIMIKAKAEKYAKIISKTIINGSGESFGQNQYFYDSAEGLLTAIIMIVAEYLPPEEIDGEIIDRRHIVSVFKMVQELLEPAKSANGKMQTTSMKVLIDKLPENHKARWFSGAALNSSEQGMLSILSTILSKLNAFLDTSMEQILCFDTEIDAETFCNNKSAVFIILPEEDATKYFMVSLFIQQFYRELLQIADENGGTLPNRVMIYADEIGTIPPIENFEMMLSAGRSRKISIVAIIQSFAQLRKNYGDEGAEIITDNTQLTIFGGFAPNSQTAIELSTAMGTRTVLSGTVSRSRKEPSKTLQMISRPLVSPDELKSIPRGNFMVMKTATNPMKTKLPLFLKWGITFDKAYETITKAQRKVYYANRKTLEENIDKVSEVSENKEDKNGETEENIKTNVFKA